MQTLVVKEEQFLTDAKGRRTGVLLDLQTYQHLRDAEEELADLQAYDSTRVRAHAEIAGGQFPTLASYRDGRGQRANVVSFYL
jgi:hypothetical protein